MVMFIDEKANRWMIACSTSRSLVIRKDDILAVADQYLSQFEQASWL